MGWRGFGFVHHSRTLFCRAVPNPNITIRNFFVAVGEPLAAGARAGEAERAAADPACRGAGGYQRAPTQRVRRAVFSRLLFKLIVLIS